MKNDLKYLDIGLEVHVQLKTATKLFSRAAIVGTNSAPNSSVAPMDLGLPGQMPILNQQAVKLAAKIALALHSKIPEVSYFDRKHYAYHDLPAGFQITQFFNSFAYGGYIVLPCGKKISVTSMHLETDAAKLAYANTTLIDYNRCGTPLLEIVFNPDIHNLEDLGETVKALQRLIVAVDASGCEMSKGQMRVDVNMSLRPNDKAPLGRRVEIKNLNSIKEMKDAVAYEIKLQQTHGAPNTEYTKGFNDKGETYVMRAKETPADYRYLPEHNLPGIRITQDDITTIKKDMPQEMPYEIFQKYLTLTNPERAAILRDNIKLAKIVDKTTDKTMAINLLTNDLLSYTKKNKISFDDLNVTNFLNILEMLDSGAITTNIFKKQLISKVFQESCIKKYIIDNNLKSITDPVVIQEYIVKVKAQMPDMFTKYEQGNEKVLQVIIGRIIGMSKGKINAKILTKILK